MIGKVVPVFLFFTCITPNNGQFQNRFGRRLDFSNFNFGLFRPQVKPKFEFPLSGFSVLGSNDITTRFSIPGLDNLPVPSDSTSSEKTTEAPLKNVFQIKPKMAMNTFPTKIGVKTRLPTESTHRVVSKRIPKESGCSNTGVKRRLPTKSTHRLVSNSLSKESGRTNEKRLKASKFPLKIPQRQVKADPISGNTLFIRRVSASNQHTTERLPLTTPYETTENPTTSFKPSDFYNNYSSDYSLLQYDYTSDNNDDFNNYDYDSSPIDYSECPGSLGECLSACSPVASIRQTAYKICVNECLDRCS